MDLQLALPGEVCDYLGDSNRVWRLDLEYLPHATLFAADEAPVRKCDIESRSIFRKNPEQDPRERVEFFGIDIVKECGPHYGAVEGWLMWFPLWSEFGHWSAYEHVIFTYPLVTWSEIAASPHMFMQPLKDPARLYPCRVNPWSDFANEDRCISLLLRARSLVANQATFAHGLRLTLAASELCDVSEGKRHVANRFAAEYLNKLREHPDVYAICAELLKSKETPSRFRAQLENEAAKWEWNSGDEQAAIERLERVIADDQYAAKRETFQSILAKLRSFRGDERSK